MMKQNENDLEPEMEILLKKLLGAKDFEILKKIIVDRGIFNQDKVD